MRNPGEADAQSARRGTVLIKELSKRYGPVTAVNSVSMEIQSGEFFALLGSSGSGKTTILNMIAGFASPTSGQILIDGVDVQKLAPHRRGIGVVFQNYALFPLMSVAENVAFPLRMRGVGKSERMKRAFETLEMVGLGNYGNRKPTELSGGQQQRVAIARAIVFRPPVLLMDEPLSALDRRLRENMQLEIKQLQRQLGTTVIYVTHDQEEALSMADKVAVMRNGNLEQVDQPEKIYCQPSNEYTAGLVGDITLLEGQVIDHSNGVVRVAMNGATLDCAGTAKTTYQKGDRVQVGIRPDRIRIRSAANDLTAGLKGVVSETLYTGPSTLMKIQTSNGDIVARVSSSSDESKIPSGSQIDISWEPKDANIF